MANEPKNMLEIKKILQLLEKGMSQREISRQLSISRNTVDYYKKRFSQSKRSYKELLELADHELSPIVYKGRSGPKKDTRYERLAPQLGPLTKELRRTGVTRLLLWKEYRQKDPDGYSYQQFCEHLNTFLEVKSAVMYLEHKPGEKLEIDFAGDKLSYIDPDTGELIKCPVFVGVLPFSGYTFAKALPNARQEQLIPTLSECLEYIQGVPLHIVTDNMAQIVKKAHRYEPSFTDLANQWSVHYNTVFTAARVRKPKDKPSVEKGVDLVYKRIFAPLRNHIFHSLKELNYHVFQALEKHNEMLFQRKEYSRKERFLQEEQPLLNPLPKEPFDLKYSIKRKVGRDYHVTLGEDWHHYSVPFRYIGRKVTMVYNRSEVEIYHGNDRIAFHQRDYRKHRHTTVGSHMPENHKAYKESSGWTPEYFIKRAERVGPRFRELMDQIICSRKFAEQSYKACLGLLRLGEKYPTDRMEKASSLALEAPVTSYGTVARILENNRDKQHTAPEDNSIPDHGNIRGKQQYLDF